MDESRRLAMRRAHVKYRYYCTCGRVVCGNGGRASHRTMHVRAGDGHRYITQGAWEAMWTKECETCLGSGAIDDAVAGQSRCLSCGGRGRVRNIEPYGPPIATRPGPCESCGKDVLDMGVRTDGKWYHNECATNPPQPKSKQEKSA